MSKKTKVIYYDDEVNDEVVGISKATIRIDGSFPYVKRSPLWRIGEFAVYRVIMKPFAFLWCKLKLGVKIIGKEKLKPYKKQGYFLFGNHTLLAGDAFVPNIIEYSKRTHVIVHPDNLSTRGTRSFVQMCGAIPVPTELSGFRPFLDAIRLRYEQGACICVYPEAHIWPYCTFIRCFPDTAFSYPVRLNAPVFCAVTTFQKRRFFKAPRVSVYIEGPFLPDTNLGTRQATKILRDEVYNTMCRLSRHSTYEFIKYVKREE